MSIRLAVCSAALVASSLGIATPAMAGTDAYVGEIIMGGWNFCPRGTVPADGKLMAIAQNTALFSLFGTTYGGDGRVTFGLPDLRSRTPIHHGQGPGLPSHNIGSKSNFSSSGSAPNTGTLAISYCVVVQGIYPSRN